MIIRVPGVLRGKAFFFLRVLRVLRCEALAVRRFTPP
jgi:hypothetical protein